MSEFPELNQMRQDLTGVGVWLGYSQLEGFLQSISKDDPLNGIPLQETNSGGQPGFHIVTHSVLLSQMDSQGVIHYWKGISSRAEFLYNQPFGGLARHPGLIALEYWVIISDFVTRQGFHLREAFISVPSNIQLMTGRENVTDFDKQELKFERREG